MAELDFPCGCPGRLPWLPWTALVGTLHSMRAAQQISLGSLIASMWFSNKALLKTSLNLFPFTLEDDNILDCIVQLKGSNLAISGKQQS